MQRVLLINWAGDVKRSHVVVSDVSVLREQRILSVSARDQRSEC